MGSVFGVCIQHKHNPPRRGKNRYVCMRHSIWQNPNSTQAAAVEAENLSRLSGFVLSKDDFQCWQMDDGEKKGKGWRVWSQYTCTDTMALFWKSAKTSAHRVVHLTVCASLYKCCSMSAFLLNPSPALLHSTYTHSSMPSLSQELKCNPTHDENITQIRFTCLFSLLRYQGFNSGKEEKRIEGGGDKQAP